jgi:hypothetical protein
LLALRRIDATHALRSSLVAAASNQISPKSWQEKAPMRRHHYHQRRKSEAPTCTRDLERKPDLDVGRVLFHSNSLRQLLPAGGQLLFTRDRRRQRRTGKVPLVAPMEMLLVKLRVPSRTEKLRDLHRRFSII